MKHKHAELIKAWADGAAIEGFWDGEWHEFKCAPDWDNFIEYRIKPPEVAQWRKDMAQALKDGKEVEFFSVGCGGWVKSLSSAEDFLTSTFVLYEENYRIKPEPKPDVVKRYNVSYGGGIYELHQDCSCDLILIWDGESGVLKCAEVLS